MLHLTNGRSTGNTLMRTRLGGAVLCWDDVLHEGPVPAHLPLEELSRVRAAFIAESMNLDARQVASDFVTRDVTLKESLQQDEIVLWFEHDLYDQLQLIQVLDWYAQVDLGQVKLSLICIDRFPGVPRFMGLGQLTAEQLATLFPQRRSVTQAQLTLARAAWHAYREPDPSALQDLLERPSDALPFLQAALKRHLEQFPSRENGLSRTEAQLLQAVAQGTQHPVELFLDQQNSEEVPFMGDSTFWTYLAGLTEGPSPLLETAQNGGFHMPWQSENQQAFREQTLQLTTQGELVLQARADRIALNGINRWLGGVHLESDSWRWNRATQRLTKA